MCGAIFEAVPAVLLVCDHSSNISKERSASIFMIEQAKYLTLNMKAYPPSKLASSQVHSLMFCGFTQSLL
jgi:hypothetical protein